MFLDRELQLKLMQDMADSYPFPVKFLEYQHETPEYYKVAINLYYLQSHGLLTENSVAMRLNFTGIGGGDIFINKPSLTSKGVDFLANDGGLSAILNVVTVKFEADTLKAILENRINQSDLAPDDKKSMIDSLRELPAESIKHLTMKLLDEGLENLPNAILLIGTYLGMS